MIYLHLPDPFQQVCALAADLALLLDLAFSSELSVAVPARGLHVKTSSKFQDLELISRSQSGDTEAFSELVAKHRAKLYHGLRCGAQ
jgi:hypothetical protein